MRAQGIENEKQFIDYESLPLMRQLFCWTFSCCCCFCLVLIAQILFYLWFVHSIIGMFHAIIPVSVLGVLLLLYLYIVDVVSISESFCISLLSFQLV